MGGLIWVASGFSAGCERSAFPPIPYELRFTKRTHESETEMGFPTGETRTWALKDARLGGCYGLKIHLSQPPGAQNAAVFGERFFKEVIKLKGGC